MSVFRLNMSVEYNRKFSVMKKELREYQEKKLQAFIDENSHFPKNMTVFIGDSITDFFSLSDYFTTGEVLINRGIAGTDTTWLLEHLDDQLLTLKPSKIFLMLGVNDLGRRVEVSRIAQNINIIIAEITKQCPQATIYLLSILPVNHSQEFAAKVGLRSNGLIREVNHLLEKIPGIIYIDLHTHLLDSEEQLAEMLTTDGLHLNGFGYAKLAKILTDYL